MDQRLCERDRTRRPIRNKRYNRRNFGEEKRPPKRLFTPEIKRFLKSWLIRRRDNPYPNRDEKKSLALQTGLTYIQVCNWFANWRRKLKNAGKEPQKKTWGHLIKTYNSQVQGNVEHFSICSDDSIWQDDGATQIYDSGSEKQYDQERFDTKYDIETIQNNPQDHCYTIESEDKNAAFINNNNITNNHSTQAQCYLISSTTENECETNPFSQSPNKYKKHFMEKYLRDCQKPENIVPNSDDCNNYDDESSKPSMFSKWRESAVKFRPSKKNYLYWTLLKPQKKKNKKQTCNNNDAALGNYQQHGREELDAAETLTRLANAHANFSLTIQ
ncbi:hypothetical protein Trydic_g10889 [Trypoxylus dichotomus]